VTKRFIRIFIDYTPEVEIFSVDEAFLDFSHLLKSENSKPQHQKSWCRGKQKTVNSYKEVLKIAFEIKKRIHDEVGEWITCSVGIGPNKMIAKLASDKIKPDGLVIVRPQEVKRFMKTVKLTDICGIASRIERRLNMLGIKTPAQIDDFSEKILVLEFGVYGRLLKLWGSGEDPTPLVPYYQDSSPKSVGHSYTLPKDTYDQREVNQYLYLLSDKVGRRARRLGYAGKTLSLYLRFADFSCWYKVKKFEFAISDSYQIYKSALFIMRCLERMKAVRMVGISLSSLIETKHTIYPLMPPERKVLKSLSAQDEINNKYGEMTITRAEFLNCELKQRVGGFLNKEDLKIH
jgi:DNA polymerase-4